jgi:single-stranded DNA-binding protein
MSIEVALFGILGRDAESKVSKNGKPYLRLNVRCGDGDVAQWVGAMVFDEQAVAAADKMLKGARVYLEGSIKLDEWTGQDGSKRAGLSVMSWHCRLAAIGQHKPRREHKDGSRQPAAAEPSLLDADDRQRRIRGVPDRDLDDPIPF